MFLVPRLISSTKGCAFCEGLNAAGCDAGTLSKPDDSGSACLRKGGVPWVLRSHAVLGEVLTKPAFWILARSRRVTTRPHVPKVHPTFGLQLPGIRGLKATARWIWLAAFWKLKRSAAVRCCASVCLINVKNACRQMTQANVLCSECYVEPVQVQGCFPKG